MRTLSIDIETYSPVDLAKSGVYAYAEHEDFEILLFAYAYGADEVICIDLAQGEKMPDELLNDLTNSEVTKSAFNANFERTCISRFFKIELPADQWDCTMVKSSVASLPSSLQQVSEILIPAKQQKLADGKPLIRYFSVPCKPTKTNGQRTRNLPEHAPAKWDTFKKYCIRDVEAERAVRGKLSARELDYSETEQALIVLDREINDRGVKVDLDLVQNAVKIDETVKQELVEEAINLTGLSNPNSVAQLKQWILDECGEEINSLSKKELPDLIANASSEAVKQVLELRKKMSKSSTSKYKAIINSVRRDGRVGGLLQFYGANRTGRWAGRLVQVQNLPQNRISGADLDLARNLVKECDIEMLKLLYGDVPNTLSQLIRTAFVAKEGHTFVVVDFSAIEARVLAWLAGEQWRINVFNSHGKIYEASAAKMFNVPIESITKDSDLRKKGKVAELALGYQGSVGALTAMGAAEMGLSDEQMQGIVENWREANPHIVSFWASLNEKAVDMISIKDRRREIRKVNDAVALSTQDFANVLSIVLPSGRKLFYCQPEIGTNRFGSPALVYMGSNQTTKKWEKTETYGGKLAENITQAVARDCLAEAMLAINAKGYKITMHVHDEVVVEVPEGEAEEALNDICDIMSQSPEWARGLPLKAEGFISEYYKK